MALCEKTIKPYVDYDNVAPIFHVCAQFEAQQMVAYCAYYSRKFEPRLCERVTPETAPQLHMLAQALGLMDLKKASEALCGDQLTNDAEEQIGCGERKSEYSSMRFVRRMSQTPRTPRPPPPNIGRERMWSA